MTLKNFLMKFGDKIASFALMITAINDNTTCICFIHQSKLPKGAEKLRKVLMPAFLFGRVIEQLVECGIIKAEEKELYSYGLQQGLIIIANVLTTIVMGVVFGMGWESIVFMAAYLPLRSFAGGYHAKTQLRCYLFSIVLTSAVLLAIKFIVWAKFINLGLALFAGVIIFILAPVEDSNKPLDHAEVAVYKKRTRIILITELFVMLLMMGLGLSQIPHCISISLTALSGMLLLGKFKNKFQI